MKKVWDGHFQGVTCKSCGVVLNEDGYHPAETYAGTCTFLCYSCMNAAPFVVETDDLDGMQSISYPPHCPSWRRDREVFTAYADCPDCKGQGFTWRPAQSDRYRHYCQRCTERYTEHPVRMMEYERDQSRYRQDAYKHGLELAKQDASTLLDAKSVKATYRKNIKSLQKNDAINLASTGERLESLTLSYMRGYLEGLGC